MKFFILPTSIILLSLLTQAQEKKIEYKNWKTFQSDYGYEFKYPDCWKIDINDPDEKGRFEQIHNLAVLESKACKTSRRYTQVPNGISFTTGYKNSYYDSIKAVDDKKNKLEKWSKVEIKNGHHLFFSRKKLDDSEFIDYVEVLHDKIYRWRRKLFCGLREISVGGPSITTTDSSYLDRFKVGDFALPEPEKTIYESIRCIEPKIQTAQKKK